MKKILYLFFVLLPFISRAQPGIIKTIEQSGMFWTYFPGGSGGGTHEMVVDNKGNAYVNCGGWAIYKITPSGAYTIIAGNEYFPGYGGDGGPATNAQFNATGYGKIAVDVAGNIYISDEVNRRVRKVNTSGIITTIAGTGVMGFSGDGGPATLAQLQFPMGIAVDKIGNVYFGDNNRIRKISTSGIITTFAGNGLVAGTGDGVPATAASIRIATDLAFDGAGNLFFLNDSFVCKINTSGIVHKVTQCNQSGALGLPFASVVGPAISALTDGVYNMDVDAAGNVYLASRASDVIRKVNTAGIISTIAGVPPLAIDPYYYCAPWLGDDILSTSAKLCGPAWIGVPPSGDVYFATEGLDGGRLCKISYTPTIASDDFSVFVTKTCIGVDHYFKMNTYLPYHNVVTYYGDGTSSSGTLINMGDGTGGINVSHSYPTSGDYSIMHVLYNGTTPKDTISYTHHHQLCNNVYVRLFYDNNSNCSFDDATELMSHTAVTIRVDSNSVPVDTLSATSGFYYTAYGNISDVYTFRVLSASDSMHVSCPTSGILTKTLTPVVDDGATMFFALSCGTNPGFNFACQSAATTGRHAQIINVLSGNKMCLPENGIVKVNFSPKYNFVGSMPSPSSVVGHTATWNFAGMSATMPIKNIRLTLETPGSMWLPPGDTVNAMIVIGPGTGDVDTTDNVIIRCDTVKYAWDPNDISVTPTGNILNGTELQYTVRFENCGNDTAHNIFILDTLSDNVDVSSLRIVAASAVMNTTIYRDGAYRIAKFDFPNIKLLDSSHHGLCDGMVIYTVRARTGLAHGTDIAARAGIYFDINPVVMTNTVHNTILIPSIAINTASGASICKDSVTFRATSNSIKAPYYEWVVNGAVVGGNSPTYLATGLTTGTVVKCILYNPAHDTVIATSNIMVMSLIPMPVAGSISGSSSLCVGQSAMLSVTVPGGVWSASNSNVIVSGGAATAMSAGNTMVTYAVSNSCGTAIATHGMTFNSLPVAGTLTGPSTVCKGASISLVPSVPDGMWSVSNNIATVVAGTVTGIIEGTIVVSYALSNTCGTIAATHSIKIEPQPVAGMLTGPTEVYKGEVIIIIPSEPGGAWTVSAGSAINHNGMVVGQSVGGSTVTYTVSNSCGVDEAYKAVTVLEPSAPTLQPNPVTSVLTIKANGEIYSSYVISNSAGKCMMEEHFTTPVTTINVRSLPAGVYYLRLVGSKRTEIKKFTKL